jgi:simple sugar transport system permease protein
MVCRLTKSKFVCLSFQLFAQQFSPACQVFEVNTADAARGNLKELEAIAAAVIGGIVMTGGFGTVLGIVVGAFIFGLAKEAFFYIPGIDGSFYRVFLGLVIVASALLNENIRKRIMGTI